MPTAFRDLLLKLCRREDLSRDEAREAFEAIMSGQATDAQIGGLLVGLAAKGTTVEELVGAATVMRQKVLRVTPDPIDKDAIILDTCGTGGDVRSTFNISTAAALIVAGRRREGRQARQPLGIQQVRLGRRAGEARREARGRRADCLTQSPAAERTSASPSPATTTRP